MSIHRTVVILALAASQLANCVPVNPSLPPPSEVPSVIDADYYYGPQWTQPPQEVPAPNFSRGPLKYPPSSPQRDAPYTLPSLASPAATPVDGPITSYRVDSFHEYFPSSVEHQIPLIEINRRTIATETLR
ncbi:hypothetical protein K443DRAFT_6498 [Laccaria amethystina LaAM-08-1]|uniref:Uncharacterized protein n=1 Tax=Laccaria amethystina LaAM-08-1 TaxID=1095629 RepID=A0A0C9XAM9_9AGAR|nr:hypothetical protein K443DRAFT_6498 [Laccaria amethystina LaAM-08-1]